MKDRLLERLGSHFKLTLYLCLLTGAAIGVLLSDAPPSGAWLPLVYQWSTVGYYGTLLLAIAVLLVPLALLPVTRWLWPLLGWGWLLYLAIDVAVFKLYRFHLDWLMVSMFVNDFTGMGIPPFLLAFYGLLALVLLGFVVWLYRTQRSGSVRHWPWFAAGLLLMPAGLALNSVINIWAVHFTREEITRYRPFLPIYYPVEMDRSAQDISRALPAVFPAAHGSPQQSAGATGGIVRYPLAAPQCEGRDDAPSILMIVLESWQAAAMTPEITPNIARFAATGTRFDQHVSSGAATVPGLFGLLYGLHASYFNHFKSAAASHPSLFTETLHAQGYRSRVFTSSNLDGFSLKNLLFPRVAKADYLDRQSDAALVDAYVASLAGQGKRFDFLFLTASHSPYSYPADYARFKPLPVVEGGFALDRQADATPYRNDYYNSLFYLDALVGKALDALRRQGRLDHTWVVITGDHAEEFNENGLGFWGHGSNFSRWQTQTPMIVRAPGRPGGKVETAMSLHQDVVPTLMREALGCRAPASAYSHGTSLFDLPAQRGTVIASYMSEAYLVDGEVLEKTGQRRYAWRDMRQGAAGAAGAGPGAVQALRGDEARFLAR